MLDFSVFSNRLDKYKSINNPSNMYCFKIYLYIEPNRTKDLYKKELVNFIFDITSLFSGYQPDYIFNQTLKTFKRNKYLDGDIEKTLDFLLAKKCTFSNIVYKNLSSKVKKVLMLSLSPSFNDSDLSGGYVYLNLDSDFLSQWKNSNEFIHEFLILIEKYEIFKHFIISPSYGGSLGSSAHVNREQNELQEEGSNLLIELGEITNRRDFDYLFWVNGFKKPINLNKYLNKNKIIKTIETNKNIIFITSEIIFHKSNTNIKDFKRARKGLQSIYKSIYFKDKDPGDNGLIERLTRLFRNFLK